MARGSIRKRGSTWTVIVDVGRDPTTRKRRQTQRGRVQDPPGRQPLAHPHPRPARPGSYVTPTRQTVGEHLLAWLPAIRSSLRPATYECLRAQRPPAPHPRGRPYLARPAQRRPAVGPVYAELHRSGRLDGAGGLAGAASVTCTRSWQSAHGRRGGRQLARNVAPGPTVRRRLPSKAGPGDDDLERGRAGCLPRPAPWRLPGGPDPVGGHHRHAAWGGSGGPLARPGPRRRPVGRPPDARGASATRGYRRRTFPPSGSPRRSGASATCRGRHRP